MIDVETVWRDIWPVVETLIHATVEEDSAKARQLVQADGMAEQALDLFGTQVFDVLLKTVLGRDRLSVTRAIETENGRYVHVEYAWPDPEITDNSITAADVVAVRLCQQEERWRVVDINPASADIPLTGERARAILLTTQTLTDDQKIPSEPWILPIALYAGQLGVPLKPESFRDSVETLFLPGLQQRGYGFMSILNGRRLWRDFVQAATPELSHPAAWAAAAEFVMGEQEKREQTQAAVAKNYKANLVQIVPRIKQIKKSLHIRGVDDRYSDFQTTQIVYKEGETNE